MKSRLSSLLKIGFALVLVSSLMAPLIQYKAQANTLPDPILVVVNGAYTANKYGSYLGEILRAEGLNAYTIMDISAVDATELAQHELVILAQTSLTSSQATMFTNYVNGGGRLLAMRPDAQIAGLFGLGSGAGSLSNGYLKINTTATVNGQQPGAGLTNSALQIHGQANQYNLQPGAVMLAELYTNTSTGTGYPAVVSSGNGRAMAFTYDLAMNVVYTRQGNPANANVDVDGDGVFRTIDLFQTAGDGAPWVNRDLIPVPQADEQQRLFARMVKQMVGEVEPMPQLWYFPGTAKTMLVLTGDAHGNPTSYFQNEINSLKAHGGKATFYLSIASEPTNASVQTWRSQGFEFGIHPYWYKPDPYPPYNITSLTQGYAVYDSWYASTFSSPKSETVRNHQIAWLGWTDAADLQASYGIAMDTDFYHWGPWLQKSDGSWPHGYITGSGQPMKFVRSDGTIIPVYQQLTELVDEQLLTSAGAGYEGLNATQAIAVSQQMIDASLAGDYAALMTQNHVDYYGEGDPQVWAEGMLDYASSHGVPIWNADQWLAFTQARHDANYQDVSWDSTNKALSFSMQATVLPNNNLTTILPLSYSGNALQGVTVDGVLVSFSQQTIKGRNVAFVSVPAGVHNFVAYYSGNIPSPTPTQIGAPTSTSAPVLTNTPTSAPTATATPVSGATATSTATPAPAGPFPSTTVLDNFNRANGAIGANWAGATDAYSISANQLSVNSDGDIYWQATRFGADQEAFITLNTLNQSASEVDLLLKAQSSSSWGAGVLEAWYSPTNQDVTIVTFDVSQGWLQHGTAIPVTIANGDQFGVRALSNGTVEVYKNGVLLASRDITTWPYYASSGYIGLWFINGSGTVADNFGGGAIAIPPTATSVPPTATATSLPPTATATPLPATATPLPATATPLPPTATATPLPPTATATPLPPTATPLPTATPTIVIPPTPVGTIITGTLVNAAYSDFSQPCAVLSNAYVSDTNGGSVALSGVQADEFNAAALDSGLWTYGSWSGGAYTPVIGGGVLTVPGGGWVRTQNTYTHGVIEAVAEFGAGAWQHLGFASDGFVSNRYFIFSTYDRGWKPVCPGKQQRK